MTEIPYSELVRIHKEVALGVEPQKPDTPEMAKLREEAIKEAAEARQQGIAFDFPTDWE